MGLGSCKRRGSGHTQAEGDGCMRARGEHGGLHTTERDLGRRLPRPCLVLMTLTSSLWRVRERILAVSGPPGCGAPRWDPN